MGSTCRTDLQFIMFFGRLFALVECEYWLTNLEVPVFYGSILIYIIMTVLVSHAPKKLLQSSHSRHGQNQDEKATSKGHADRRSKNSTPRYREKYSIPRILLDLHYSLCRPCSASKKPANKYRTRFCFFTPPRKGREISVVNRKHES